jgi:sigma-B regulation protein RsbU (phosphoserine phosphatase)
MSIGGYIFVRSILLNQWGETAIAELQRTAHQIDMRMRKPKDLLQVLQVDGKMNISGQVFEYILQKINNIDGVIEVKVSLPQQINKNLPAATRPSAVRFSDKTINEKSHKKSMARMTAMKIRLDYTLGQLAISLPKYDSRFQNRTVSLVSELKTTAGDGTGRIEIIISFDTFVDQVIAAPWWKSNNAYLVDDTGNILASTFSEKNRPAGERLNLFGLENRLEKATLQAIQQNNSGMVFGDGSPPNKVSGFYHLVEAPWTLVIVAPGEKILRPIIRFKMFYSLSIAVCILLILFFIRRSTNRITTMIKEITLAAENLAQGEFGPPLPVTTVDEVGELAECFNKMTRQLKQRLRLKEALNVAREVQQNLLPHTGYSSKRIIIDGISNYCDETGGDYFDIIPFPGKNKKVGIVVGDVVGHGIGAALLMTTVRALLRCRISQHGSLSRIMNDVNKLLCRDTEKTGNFVTLFYLEYDETDNAVKWVRCGHDPAIVYSPASHGFFELKGKGTALGIAPDCRFECNEMPTKDNPLIILIGSDGLWENENPEGEQFGKDRVKELLALNSALEPSDIIQAIIKTLQIFLEGKPLEDDITLVIIKIGRQLQVNRSHPHFSA